MKLYLPDDPGGKLPMHPDDHAALLEWVRAKEGRGAERIRVE